MSEPTEVSRERIQATESLIRPHSRRTPILEVEGAEFGLNSIKIVFKLELFQHSGSFKARGAFNKMLSLSPDDQERGVVAVSGGNHAQAVAYAASILGKKAVIVMPQSTPQVYVDATRGYGADIDLQPSIADAFAKVEDYRSDE